VAPNVLADPGSSLYPQDAAEKAISKMDQAELDGRTIRVNESRPKGSSAPDGGGGSGRGGTRRRMQALLEVPM
jgi:RNA recognition motif-containing protein